MSWLYLPASVVSNSVLKQQAVSDLCATLNAIRTRPPSSKPGCKRARSRTRLYGTTFPRLTGVLGAALWTSSLAGSRAKICPTPEKVQELRRELAPVYGPRCSESFARFDLNTSLWRTCQLSLLAGLDVYSETWPRAGTMRIGIVYQHKPLVPLTGAIGCSWSRGVKLMASQSRLDADEAGQLERRRSLPLNTAVKAFQLSPTPERGGSSTLRMWTTPKSSPSGPDLARSGRPGSGRDDLATQVAKYPTPRTEDGQCASGHRGTDDTLYGKISKPREGLQNPGQLNPTWVEWLMGFPLGWTDLRVLETLSCPKWLTGSD